MEGDYVAATPEEERKYLSEYRKVLSENRISEGSLYHIDIPFTLATPKRRKINTAVLTTGISAKTQ